MIKWIAIAILSIGLAGTAYWGFQQSNQRETLLIQNENNYQRAFHDLTYHLDLLYGKIGTTLALNTNEQLSPQMLEIWQLTSRAQTDVNQLPLVLLPFSKTEGFLSEIGDFTYDVAVRNLDDEPLSQEETEKLNGLYEAADEIRQELRTIQHEVMGKQLRWVDVELALTDMDPESENFIVDGFTTIEDSASNFTETHFQNLSATLPQQHERFSFLTGSDVSEVEAIDIIRKQFDLNEDLAIDLQKSGEGAQLQTYSGSFTHDDHHGYVEISEKGGHILSYMINRDFQEAAISLNDAQKKAEQLLEEQGLDQFIIMQASQFEQVGLFQFVGNQDDIWIYPDKIMVKVALDTGEIVGFSAADFYRNHRDRELSQPELSLEEAEEKVNQSLTIEDYHLAIVEDNEGNEVLTYAFFGTLNHDTYRIFIDANTGYEVVVELLQDVENNWGNRLTD
ncbi:spore germination protein [Amphibacillus marinus]|uniref:Spore germination protein n=1 Tax=Amphibacillus marinus TaxID=872970 RepID=A0A1H8GDW7_9BACI|nr:germination protein YpeB [Amphibacillus marinus]SEN42183.1 spore germination protein [Amphibacillus marinus]